MADVTTGIVVWYQFEDTTTTDSSGNGYTGTFQGSPPPTLGPGRIGQGAVFAGATGGVLIPSTAVNVPTATSSCSIMAWIKTTAGDGNPIFSGRDSTGTPVLDLVTGYNGVSNSGTGFASAVVRDNNGANFFALVGTSAVNDGTFHHIAAVLDGTGQTLQLYVDGVQQGSTLSVPLAAGITFGSAYTFVGREAYSNWGFTGTIDDFRFYNVALTATDIANIYGAAPPPATPKTFWILNTAAPSPNYFGQLQDSSAAPTAILSTYGWTVAKSSTAYWRARLGASTTATTAAATSYIDSTTGPTAGTGATNTTAGDAFISPTNYTGIFSSGNWTFSFGMRTAAPVATGRVRCRVWASVNANGSSARELTSGALIGSIASLAVAGTTYTSSVTWAAPQITLNNEYLFFQVEWNVTTAGTNNTSTAQFYVSAASITTTGFTVSIAGTLAITQAAQTISATGNVPVVISGTLAITEVPDTISAVGRVTVGGALGVTQAAQTLSATGNVPLSAIAGTLALTQANQTLSAAGGPRVGGTLSVTQANQTLAATGSVILVGNLTVTQAAQTLVAAGGAVIGAALNVTQSAQTLSAAGRVTVGGTLNVTQANNTLVAAGGVTVRGTLSVNQAAQTLSGTGSVLSGIVGSLNVTQAAQILSAAGNVPNVIGGSLNATQSAQTLSATGTVFTGITGALTIAQADQTLSATGNVPIGAITGTLNLTQTAQTLSATGNVPSLGVEPMHTLSAGSLYVAGSIKTAAGPVSGLPLPGRAGTRNFVTDATVPFASGVGNIVTGGGSNRVPVYDDGANWRIG